MDDVGTVCTVFGLSFYKYGKSYHMWWIRRDTTDKMIVMDPLPYTPGKDDPDNPDESGEVSILVNIYVKNWVVRSNGGIIL